MTPPQTPPRRQGWTAGRTVGAVSGGAMALIGFVIALAGVAVIAAYAFARDDDGFLTSGTERLESSGYAITTENIDLGNPADTAPDDLLGTIRVHGESAGRGDIFIGVASREQVESYLGNAGHSVLTDIDDPEYREVPGGKPADPPGDETFWAADASGAGEQTMEWEVEGGDWSVVMMNADGSRPVALDAGVGIKLDWLIWIGIGLFVLGGALVAGGVLLVVIMSREAREPAWP